MAAGRDNRFTNSAIKEDNRRESKQEEITRAHISPSNRKGRQGKRASSHVRTAV
ncbi:hypothetical protein X777_13001 [Ooceraea biroi]|uniref:Uncharacterized protein n=1 Tax=Ooceraea biroi TaxID=2015173 RepID=A0A026VYH0_OOCBI|nr:hypothetical protein X777_13001 [Ooceraea biroi]